MASHIVDLMSQGPLRQRVIEALVDQATDYAIIATDQTGVVTLWNAGASHVLGWSEAEMLGRSAAPFFTPEDVASGVPAAEMQEALAIGRLRIARWHMTRDGGRFWGAGELLMLRDTAGGEAGFLRIMRDRTDERLALEASRTDAEFLRSVLAASGDCIKVLDTEGRLLFMNEGGKRLMEVADFAEVAGRFWPGLWQGVGYAAAERAVIQAREGGIGQFRGEAETLGGKRKSWDVRVTPMLDGGGRPDKLLVVSRDITENEAAQRELARSEERLSLALNASGMIGIWDWDMLTALVYADAYTAPLYGFDAERAANGIPQSEFIANIHPEDLPGFRDEIGRVVAENDVFSREYRVMQADGSSRWVLARGRPVHDAAGVAVRFPGTVVDITDRKRSDIRRVALMELGDHLRDLSDPLEMAFAGAAAMGHALDLSRASYGSIDGARESILIERDWSVPGIASIAGEHYFRDYGTYIEDLKAGRAVIVEDTRLDPRTSDMAEAWDVFQVRSLINLPIFEMGAFVALFLVHRTRPSQWLPEEVDYIRNVADRIRVAIERSRAERRLREFAASLEAQVAERTRERDRSWRVSRDLLGVCDSQGVWRSINPAWTDILGWEADDVVGRSSRWFSHPENERPSPALMAAAAGPGLPQATHHYEGRYRARDGAYRWISWTVVVDEGELYCVGRDVTAEKEQAIALAEAEAQLRQAQKMEAVGQLTGGIAHDFNNLLAGITGSLELMQTRISQGRVAEAARFVSAAQGAAQRAAALTHRLLAFSRRQTLDPKPTAANRLIHGMEDLVRRTVGPAITLDVIGAVGLWTTLCDPNQLENALLNLCINARDAMPHGGRLTIETANADLDARAARTRDLPPGQYVALSVSDTGVGMSPEVIERVFEPFFTTKPIGQGTGLGLSMVYGFAKQSGGQVRIYSEPQRGTTVKIYLPRHVGAPDSSAAEPPSEGTLPDSQATRTVLVVDDEPTVLMLVCEVLRDIGFVTLEAADGPSALQVLQSTKKLDLMITDVGLPGGMNGRQLADAALLKRPDLKILFITGYAENAALGGHVGPGMHVMTKPFAIEALITKVTEISK